MWINDTLGLTVYTHVDNLLSLGQSRLSTYSQGLLLLLLFFN